MDPASRAASGAPLPVLLLAWAGALAALILAALAIVWLPQPGEGDWAYFVVIFWVLEIGLAFTGAVVAGKRPGNPLGWLLLSASLLLGLSIGGAGYAQLSIEHHAGQLPLTVPLAWLGSWGFVTGGSILAIFVPLLFPTGRLPSPRWRIIWVPAAFGPLTAGASSAFRPGPLDVTSIDNPLGIAGAGPTLDLLNTISIIVTPAVLLAVIVSLVQRYRRGSSVQRDQLKWFAYPASVAALGLAIGLSSLGPISDVAWIVSFSAMTLVPIAIGIAILRHRLFDIDVLINRSLVYGALTVVLGLVYVGSVLVLGELLRPLTETSDLAVAAATLAVAALFQPLRRRIQAVVDRRFYRSRYDAGRVVSGFSSRLRDAVELDYLTDALRSTTMEALHPTSVSVWLRQRAGDR